MVGVDVGEKLKNLRKLIFLPNGESSDMRR